MQHGSFPLLFNIYIDINLVINQGQFRYQNDQGFLEIDDIIPEIKDSFFKKKWKCYIKILIYDYNRLTTIMS